MAASLSKVRYNYVYLSLKTNPHVLASNKIASRFSVKRLRRLIRGNYIVLEGIYGWTPVNSLDIIAPNFNIKKDGKM